MAFLGGFGSRLGTASGTRVASGAEKDKNGNK